MKGFRSNAVYFAWVIALIGVLGSLYYGEILRIEPCRLCWYQRIGMFPLALFLGIATYKNDRNLAFYCLPLVVLGALFALYQSLLQAFPSLHLVAVCGEATPCIFAGHIPYLSLASFIAIGLFILLFLRNPQKK
ncbi:MAG: disulfide bond formation protein B [Chlamydiales bacterium]